MTEAIVITFDKTRLSLCGGGAREKMRFSGMTDGARWVFDLRPKNTVSPEQMKQLKESETFLELLPALDFDGIEEVREKREQQLEERSGKPKLSSETNQLPQSKRPPKKVPTNKEEEVQTENKPFVQNLVLQTVPQAEEIIKKETDIPTLRRWDEEDDRKGIELAVQLRIKQLENASKTIIEDA